MVTEQRVSPVAVGHQEVERRVSRSLVALALRQVLAYGAIFLGNVFLSRHLTQSEYGIFAAALAFQTALMVLADLGLGAALVQRAETPTPRELSSLFTLQLLLFGALAAGAWLLAPLVAAQAGLPEGEGLVRALALVLCLTALRSIGAMLLERELRFDVIALAETVSTVLYQVVLVALVWSGLGVASIVWALAVRYGSDMLIILRFCPWRPRLSWQMRSIWPYVRFGLSMQAVRLLVYAKDYLPLLLLVPLLGQASAGQWGWAMTYVALPIFFLRLVDRVVFPAFARVQHDRAALGALAGTALWLSFAIGLPILLVLVLFAPVVIPLVYEGIWLGTLPIIQGLLVNIVASFVTGTLFPMLYGMGQTRLAMRFFALWVALTLVGAGFGLWAARLPGMAVGYSAATLVLTLLLVRGVRPLADLDLRAALAAPLLAALGGAGAALALQASAAAWPVAIGGTMVVYGTLLVVLGRARLVSFAQQGLRPT